MRRAIIVIAGVCALSGCVRLFFQPYREYVRTPAQIGLDYQDIAIETRDKLQLHAWYLPASAPQCATVLFLHGNAENISTHIASVYWLPERGFNVLLLDYRGYGPSTGSPSIAGLQTDIDAAMRYLIERSPGNPPRLVLFGQSLGAAAAIYYAAHGARRGDIRALVADSAFASYRDIAREKMADFWLTWPFQWIPDFTVPIDYDPKAAVKAVSPIPLLLVHGAQDRIVPIDNSRRLFEAASEPKQFWRVEGAGHIGAFHSASLRTRLVSYLHEHVCPSLSGASD